MCMGNSLLAVSFLFTALPPHELLHCQWPSSTAKCKLLQRVSTFLQGSHSTGKSCMVSSQENAEPMEEGPSFRSTGLGTWRWGNHAQTWRNGEALRLVGKRRWDQLWRAVLEQQIPEASWKNFHRTRWLCFQLHCRRKKDQLVLWPTLQPKPQVWKSHVPAREPHMVCLPPNSAVVSIDSAGLEPRGHILTIPRSHNVSTRAS